MLWIFVMAGMIRNLVHWAFHFLLVFHCNRCLTLGTGFSFRNFNRKFNVDDEYVRISKPEMIYTGIYMIMGQHRLAVRDTCCICSLYYYLFNLVINLQPKPIYWLKFWQIVLLKCWSCLPASLILFPPYHIVWQP